jgi:hypothetical protein
MGALDTFRCDALAFGESVGLRGGDRRMQSAAVAPKWANKLCAPAQAGGLVHRVATAERAGQEGWGVHGGGCQ